MPMHEILALHNGHLNLAMRNCTWVVQLDLEPMDLQLDEEVKEEEVEEAYSPEDELSS